MKLLEEYGLDSNKVAKFELYRNLLLEWNEKFNLTAITDKDEIEEKHFLDSLFIYKFVSLDNKSLLDIGSGAGFPGLALAIAHPTLKVTLLESNKKKTTFLAEAVKALGLDNVRIVNSRAEDFKERESFDIVTARAVKELNILIELCFAFVKVKGQFIAYKSNAVEEEITHAKRAFKTLEVGEISKYMYTLPTHKDVRVLLVISKNKITKKRYPRNYSEIVKAPL